MGHRLRDRRRVEQGRVRRVVTVGAGSPQEIPGKPKKKPLRPFSTLDLSFPDSPGHQTCGDGHIYALVDPRDSTVRYVGYSASPNIRHRQHAAGNVQNRELRTWELELHAAGLEPRFVVLTRAGANWEIHERRWIRYFRIRGRIYNKDPGGIPWHVRRFMPQKDMPRRLVERLRRIRERLAPPGALLRGHDRKAGSSARRKSRTKYLGASR